MALYLRKKLDNKAEIAVWHVTETEEELMNITSVPTDELEEIMLFRSESQRRQKLAVRALINEVFEEKMYLNHHDNGKPYLENSVTNISITHTENYVAIIISDNDELGIDIESLDRNFAAVEKRHFPRMRSRILTTTRRTSSSPSIGVQRRQSSRECHRTEWILRSR